jgi:putative nucleotidyltransferase with HDIG domain
VTEYAVRLAEAAGFDERTLFWFRMGALLHDVGKLVVPSEVLNKPGMLTPEERRLMEHHPVAGVELVAGIDFPWDIRPMIRHHHEWWNGSGYPDKLAGADIPLAARILCIADVYDALTTDRPYRPAYTHERAIEIMEADAGRLFDPSLWALYKECMSAGLQAGLTTGRWSGRRLARSR